ncbi:hypothetical protein CLV63_11226 [Murinocardiopsis flavida]|uniref:DUF7715 domain-containing protein n=1 Tax=Murinocardiopsis flavida TaxID=645275 RepID=A0A2P8DG07_9ACTN|nr:hypothetical protein [Murinocardiopsis flavida]PSK96144.1 hypothetical protein CLV63_11226 [Murinocardiopsis flavida]
MKLLTAPAARRVQTDNEFNWCIEGELVIADTVAIDCTCGCNRSFTGLRSRRATTTALVTEVDLTREEIATAIRDSYERSGLLKYVSEADLAETTQDVVEFARPYQIGDVLERRGDEVRVRR